MFKIEVGIATLSCLFVLSACGGGDSSSSQSDKSAADCIDTNLVETGGSNFSITNPETGEQDNFDIPGSLTMNVTNSCDVDVNSIDDDGIRYVVPSQSTINTGSSALIKFSCRAPYRPKDSSSPFENSCIE